MSIFPKPDFFDIENTLTVEEVIELLESLKGDTSGNMQSIPETVYESIFNERIDEVIKKLNQTTDE